MNSESDRERARARERGQALLAAGEPGQAVDWLEHSLERFPDDPALNVLAGQARLALGEPELALDHFHLALHYDPANAAALRGRVAGLERSGKGARIENAYREFIAANPASAEARFGLARALHERGEFDSAAKLLEEALESEPRHLESLNLLGLIEACEFGRLQQGESLARRALALQPGFDAARCNLGWILALERRHEEALACLDEVLARDPGDNEARLMRAYLHLRRGAFAEGWKDIESRHHSSLAAPRPFNYPRWQGEALADQSLLVCAEQGVGDQIMYASCLPDVLARAASVIVECDRRLVRLFQRSFPGASVRPEIRGPLEDSWLKQAGSIDRQIPMGSIPALFRHDWADFPRHEGYLRPDPQMTEAWSIRLNAVSPLPKVGISWRGGSLKTRRRLRSIPLEAWGQILGLPATFVSLQYGEVEQDIRSARRAHGVDIAHFPEAIDDFDDAAALIGALDLVISVCTAAVHLSGALGKQTWVLTPFVPEWRYLESGETMPWYPAVRLFRQQDQQAWEPVLGDIAAKLNARLAARSFVRD